MQTSVVLAFALLAVVATVAGDGKGGQKHKMECRGQKFIFAGVKDAFEACKPKLQMGGDKNNAGGENMCHAFNYCMMTELNIITTEGSAKKFHKEVLSSAIKGLFAAPVGTGLAETAISHCTTDAIINGILNNSDMCKATFEFDVCFWKQAQQYCK